MRNGLIKIYAKQKCCRIVDIKNPQPDNKELKYLTIDRHSSSKVCALCRARMFYAYAYRGRCRQMQARCRQMQADAVGHKH